MMGKVVEMKIEIGYRRWEGGRMGGEGRPKDFLPPRP